VLTPSVATVTMPIVDAESEFRRANELFVDEDYESALESYNSAIELDDTNSDYFVKRSACHLKLKQYMEALQDANIAVNLNDSNPRAYFRKGIACFYLDEFETALEAFHKSQELESSNSSLKTWIRKCKAEIQSERTQASVQAPISTAEELSNSACATPVPSSTEELSVSGTPTVEKNAGAKPPRFRHEWYQSQTHVTVTIFAKNQSHETACIDIKPKSLSVTIRLEGEENWNLSIDLADEVDVAESKPVFMSTKIEIRLKKQSQQRWESLEDTGAVRTRKWDSTETVNKHAYPSSSKQSRNWDEIEKSIEEDKLEGEHALQKVFQDIYAGGSEEQRRAMMKSYLESGGTVLSTNWEDVGARHVDGTPPKGLEMKKWETT